MESQGNRCKQSISTINPQGRLQIDGDHHFAGLCVYVVSCNLFLVFSCQDAEILAVKVLSKTMDTTSPSPDRSNDRFHLVCVIYIHMTCSFSVEFASVRRVDDKVPLVLNLFVCTVLMVLVLCEQVVYHIYTKDELVSLLKRSESMLLEQKKKQEKESVGDI
jgi:hypothetical protein